MNLFDGLNILEVNGPRGRHTDSWYADTATGLQARPALMEEVQADVCILGAGYTGLSAALHLAKRGAKVVVLDAARVGWGASGRNGGQCGAGQREDVLALEDLMGKDAARALWQLGQEAGQLVRNLIADHQIDCHYQPGVLGAATGSPDHEKRLVDHLAKHYGHEARYLDKAAIRDEVATESYSGGMLDLSAGHLHPLSYAIGLARAAEAAGAEIYEQSPGRIDGRLVRTERGSVTADQIIIACNGYQDDEIARRSPEIMPINNFIIATEPVDPAIIPNNYAVHDDKFVVNYYRLSHDKRMLFGGTESYRYRFPKDIKALVRPKMLEVFPQLESAEITHGWGGTLGITRARLPLLRQRAPHLWQAGGYSGHGITIATLAGKLLAEAMHGQPERFNQMAAIPSPPFPGGPLMRWPLLVLGMTWYRLRDELGI
ncbi:NAD(P)/FAD-dependent oxidoreductase [Paracoccaceae bacterium GXU_MW_L88]